ncbi:hypothetical protein [Butyrivibrio proteoclasticus]|uniref:hypothetical protein n=1 Tax=Butyrivibrio proteoclasticus TaxID=43305 RepID=UPI00047BD5AB|nr:hypothetical protein [Butyrivibrio proteoclasticus]
MQEVSIIKDPEGQSIVIVNDIIFKGRRGIDWQNVQGYLKKYIGQSYEVLETSDVIYIGSDFPEELKGSEDTKRTRGGNAKAKANATTVIPFLIENATNKRWQDNYKSKHGYDAKYGWYRFTTRFALPLYDEKNELIGYNVYRIEMLIRHASDGKLYLYDMVNTKKETSTPLEQ